MCFTGSFVPNMLAVNADFYSQQLERVHEILRRTYPVFANWNGVLWSRKMWDPILQEQSWQKSRKWEESNCYHTQHTALILCLQITICFHPWLISCMEEISKTLKLWKWCSPNSSCKKPETDNCRRIINLAERWLRTIESVGLYFEE